MAFLDTALKVIRLLSAIVWLAVGVVTLWGTYVTFRDLGPYLSSLSRMIQQVPAGPTSGFPGGAAAFPQIQRLLDSAQRQP